MYNNEFQFKTVLVGIDRMIWVIVPIKTKGEPD